MMKKKLMITILFFLLIYIFFPSWTSGGEGQGNGIYQLMQEEIAGTRLEIMIRGNSTENPVLLWVSGEDEFSEICYISKYQEALEEAFTIVRYDKRGTGKSVSLKAKKQNVTLDDMVEEVLAVTDYVRAALQIDQVILIAQGYATVFAIRAAKKAPEKYSAYVGISQYTNLDEMQERMIAYCLDQAVRGGNEQDIIDLAVLQKADGFKGERVFKYYRERYIEDLEIEKRKKDYTIGFLLQPEYNIADAIMAACIRKPLFDLLFDEIAQRDLTIEVNSLSIPCFFACGKEDHVAVTELCEGYLNKMQAPYKELKIFEESGEYPYRQEETRFVLWLESAYEKVQKEE